MAMGRQNRNSGHYEGSKVASVKNSVGVGVMGVGGVRRQREE